MKKKINHLSSTTASDKFLEALVSRRSFLKTTGAAAAGIALLPNQLRAQEAKKLNFYNWDTYIGETTLPDFKKATGITVTMDLFGDNDELFAKLKGGNPGYDLIVPSDTFVERMWKAGMLEKLNYQEIPNAKNIDNNFLNPGFDPGRTYSVPYMWGTMGIGYRKSRMRRRVPGGVPNSYKWILDSKVFSGKISCLNEASSMIGMMLKFLGKDPNSTSESNINQAAAQFIKQKKHIKSFAEDNGQDLLAAGEVDLAIEYSGDIVQLMSEDEDIGFALPADGSYRWEDTLAIPKGAPHPLNAHKFIDYILSPTVGRDIAEFIGYGTPNSAARKLTSKAYRSNPSIFPSQAVMSKLWTQRYLGETVNGYYEKAWTRILAA